MALDIQDKKFITSTILTAVNNSYDLVRGEFKSEFDSLKSEFKSDLKNLRSEFKLDSQSFRGEFKSDLNEGLQSVRSEFSEFRVQMNDDMQRHTGILKEHFEHNLAMVVELVKDKPGREEVREIVREETGHIVRKEMKETFAPEVKEIRVKQNNHEKRIGKLESALI